MSAAGSNPAPSAAARPTPAGFETVAERPLQPAARAGRSAGRGGAIAPSRTHSTSRCSTRTTAQPGGAFAVPRSARGGELHEHVALLDDVTGRDLDRSDG